MEFFVLDASTYGQMTCVIAIARATLIEPLAFGRIDGSTEMKGCPI